MALIDDHIGSQRWYEIEDDLKNGGQACSRMVKAGYNVKGNLDAIMLRSESATKTTWDYSHETPPVWEGGMQIWMTGEILSAWLESGFGLKLTLDGLVLDPDADVALSGISLKGVNFRGRRFNYSARSEEIPGQPSCNWHYWLNFSSGSSVPVRIKLEDPSRAIVRVRRDGRPYYNWSVNRTSGLLSINNSGSDFEITVIDPHPVIVQIYMVLVSFMAALTALAMKIRSKLNWRRALLLIFVGATLILCIIYAPKLARFTVTRLTAVIKR